MSLMVMQPLISSSRSRASGLCSAVVFGAVAGLAAQAPATSPNRSDAPRASNDVTVVGCLQRGTADAAIGIKSPSGFLLRNASNSPFGGSAGPGGVEQSAPGGPPPEGPPSQLRSGDSTPGPAGGAGVSPGLTYLLEGGTDLAAYVGQRIEVRGTLQAAAGTDKVPLVPRMSRGGAPSNPQRIRIASIRSVGKDCSR
jgi:hypothetical protein